VQKEILGSREAAATQINAFVRLGRLLSKPDAACYPWPAYPAGCPVLSRRGLFPGLSGAEKSIMRTRAARIFVSLFLFGLVAGPASAQYGAHPLSDPATGETYHVEIGGYLWNPTPDISITSQSLTRDALGTPIDFVKDLGIEQTRFKQLKVVLRPARKHKLRFEYTPISYEAVGTLKREIVFNGQRYNIALPISSDLQWKAYRFVYEYDFVYRDRGFAGLLLETKYTDVRAELTNLVVDEFVSAKAPIPTVGLIGRAYVAPNISITGELSGLGTGGLFGDDYSAHYIDFDLYGTVNFNDHVGTQVGYRTFNVFYHVKRDEGELLLKGFYFGGVARF